MLPRGRIKERPEDFVVEEIPAYEPSGEGEHVFVRFTKRDLGTLDTVRAIAEACGCDPREAGHAGMKDKRAVATQTISLHAPRGVDPAALAERARALALPGIDVLASTRHANKLKPGHLFGNRFTIVVRGLTADSAKSLEAGLAEAARVGVPNAFGAQRFGADGDNAERARRWLRGEERPPRDRRMQRFLWSAFQSRVFNAVLRARVADGSHATPLEGDLLKVHSSGGLFVCTAVQTDSERAERGEVSPTGPLVGARMRWPEGVAGDLERRVAAEHLEGIDLAHTRHLGEGSRRSLRLWVSDLRWEIVADPGHAAVGVRVYFVLPKGGYATTVLETVLTIAETERASAASLPPTEDEQSE